MTTARIDLIISAVVAFLGLIMWWGTLGIETDAGMFEGPRLLPSLVAVGLLLLAGLLIASGTSAARTEAADGKPSTGSPWHGFTRIVVPLTGLVLVYVGLLNGFGYLIATLLVAPGAFMLFGNRGPVQALVLPIGLAVLYYLLFFQLLGMFDPPGAILDLSEAF